jgi:hypothetical protein
MTQCKRLDRNPAVYLRPLACYPDEAESHLAGRAVALSEPDLWAIIRDWHLPYRRELDELSEPPRHCTRFEHNLRRIGDWTDDASKGITQAYRKFLYIKALSGGTLSPPTWIDAAWHFHLSFAKNYGELEAAIGRKIEHRQDLPRAEIHQAYERGRSLWEAEFDEEPPLDLWPARKLILRNRIKDVLAVSGFFALTAAVASFGISGFGELVQIAILVSWLVMLVCFSINERQEPDTISRCG